MPGVRIRPLTAADAAEWRRLWAAYLDFYQTTLPEAVGDTTLARLLSDDPREFRCLLAESDGQVLGLVHYHFHRTTWAIGDSCYLQDLYVDPAARGTGLGRALIEAVYAAADAAGAAEVYWITHEENRVAQRLYDRLALRVPFLRYERGA